jgi:hypothetical protein
LEAGLDKVEDHCASVIADSHVTVVSVTVGGHLGRFARVNIVDVLLKAAFERNTKIEAAPSLSIERCNYQAAMRTNGLVTQQIDRNEGLVSDIARQDLRDRVAATVPEQEFSAKGIGRSLRYPHCNSCGQGGGDQFEHGSFP